MCYTLAIYKPAPRCSHHRGPRGRWPDPARACRARWPHGARIGEPVRARRGSAGPRDRRPARASARGVARLAGDRARAGSRVAAHSGSKARPGRGYVSTSPVLRSCPRCAPGPACSDARAGVPDGRRLRGRAPPVWWNFPSLGYSGRYEDFTSGECQAGAARHRAALLRVAHPYYSGLRWIRTATGGEGRREGAEQRGEHRGCRCTGCLRWAYDLRCSSERSAIKAQPMRSGRPALSGRSYGERPLLHRRLRLRQRVH